MLLYMQGCKDECEDIVCSSPPLSYSFELVDKTTGENLFENGTLDYRYIEVANHEDDKKRIEEMLEWLPSKTIQEIESDE